MARKAQSVLRRMFGASGLSEQHFNKRMLLVFVVLFGSLGAVLLFRSFAAGPIMSVQGEATSAQRSGNLAAQSDGTASSGSYVQFGQIITNPGPTGQKCIVILPGKGHGKGGSWTSGDTRYVQLQGNSQAWGGYQFLYYPESEYSEVHTIVESGINSNGCGRVIIHGFSNGAAAAAKLYCRGETFGNRMVGYIIDDPVTDAGTNNCQRPAGIQRVMYWTGDLNYAYDGWNCAPDDWTCEGGYTIGPDRTQSNLGVVRKQSIHYSHAMYENPPERTQWW